MSFAHNLQVIFQWILEGPFLKTPLSRSIRQHKLSIFRSSHRRCSVRRGVLVNFAKFTGKHMCQSVFFNKVAGFRPATLWKRDSGTGVFLWILPHFKEHLSRTPLVAASESIVISIIFNWTSWLLNESNENFCNNDWL